MRWCSSTGLLSKASDTLEELGDGLFGIALPNI